MELVCVSCSHLKVPTVHPDGSLRQGQVTNKAEIQRPDAWVLSNRKSSERTVKCLPTSCDLALRHKELAVIEPNSRHLEKERLTVSFKQNFHRLQCNAILCWLVVLYRMNYLMHEHQCPFVAVIDLLIAWVSDTFPLDLFPSLSQIIVPQLIAVKTGP